MYLINFHINHPSYNVGNKGKLGLLISETVSIPIKQVICLQPKCYSVLLDNDSCNSTAKGVSRSHRVGKDREHIQRFLCPNF